MKWSNQYKELPNQSKFHEKLRAIFCEEMPFKNMKCYQEVPVTDLIEGYPYTTQRFDWYIEELNVVIELHGVQHYKPTSFGNQSFEKKRSSFYEMQSRDINKKIAIQDAGFSYLEIPYKDINKLSAQYIVERL